MSRLLRIVFCCSLALGAAAPAACADGLPVGGLDVGPTGVAAPGGDVRYVTLAESSGTVVAAVQRAGGRVVRSRVLPDQYTIPAVALDGSASGLSTDGSTLVLIKPRSGFPRQTTPLAILDAARLQVRKFVKLPGDYSFDAISPDGRSIYLIHYTSRNDPTSYEVRAYDVRAGRMVTAPVVDPLDEENMGGLPVTRATSADGRWAYTLYDRAGKPPFVHALDTRGRTAKCIDLDLLGARRTDVYQLKLGIGPPSSGKLSVTAKGSPVAVIDTRTFRVSAPGAGAPATRAHEDRHAPWALLAAIGGALLLAGGAGLSLTRRRRRLAPT